MFGLAENMILTSAEGFFFRRRRVLCAYRKITFWDCAKSVIKSSILAKCVQLANGSGWLRFVLLSSSPQGANHYFLVILWVWEKTIEPIFCTFSSMLACDRAMVPSTTLESFKSGACVVPGSTWDDLQTHTNKTTGRCFGCLVEMDENCHVANMCTYENRWCANEMHTKNFSTPRFFNNPVRCLLGY